jgi:hypothetical protein
VFTTQEATEERVSAYVDALKREKEGYEARVQRIKEGLKDPLTGDNGLSKEQALDVVKGRIKGVEAEVKRVTGIDTADPDDDQDDLSLDGLLKLSRDDLNAKALEAGVEEPEQLKTKQDVAEAIVAALAEEQ